MPVYNRDNLPDLYNQAKSEPFKVYLFIGDRFLCRQTAAKLEQILLTQGGTVHSIDGEEEDPVQTVARMRSFSLLPGRQLYRVADTRLFHSKKVAASLWKRVLKARAENKTETAVRNLLAMLAAAGLQTDDSDSDPSGFSSSQWKKLFDFAHPGGDLSWVTSLLAEAGSLSKPVVKSQTADPGVLLQETIETGIPGSNFLLLLAEEVDKRKRLFKYLKEHQGIVDLSVEQGASSRAQKEQRSVLQELVTRTLNHMGKSMDAGILDQLLDRVGFYPVAVAMETEKLCLSIGDRKKITREDLDAIVGRTRQEALFELTGAIGARQLGRALVLCTRLVDNSVHPLAIIATLRNFTRTLLLFRSLMEQPHYGYTSGMQANIFQRQSLPKLKEQQRWQQELSGHPYSVFMQFKTAESFSLDQLSNWLGYILDTELRLKGSPLEPVTLLHHLLVEMHSLEPVKKK